MTLNNNPSVKDLIIALLEMPRDKEVIVKVALGEFLVDHEITHIEDNVTEVVIHIERI